MSRQELGSRYRLVHTSVGQMTASANNTTTLELPNTLLIKSLILRLTGSVTVGTADATATGPESPLSLIRKVEVIGDGRAYLVSASARELYRYSQAMRRAATELSAPGLTQAAQTFSATLTIDFDALNAVDPSESMFDPRLYKKVELRVTWGAATDLLDPAATTTLTLGTTTLDVGAVQTAEGVGQILFDHLLSVDEKTVTATSTSFTMDVPQSGLLAGILISARVDAGTGAGEAASDSVINRVSFVSDSTIYHVAAMPWQICRQFSRAKYFNGVDVTGYHYLDFMENGMFSSALNINALNKAQLIFDVTYTSGTVKLRTLYDFFAPRRMIADMGA